MYQFGVDTMGVSRSLSFEHLSISVVIRVIQEGAPLMLRESYIPLQWKLKGALQVSCVGGWCNFSLKQTQGEGLGRL